MSRELHTPQYAVPSPTMNHTAPLSSRKGFTLIELIVVITIIAILAAVIFIAVDPAKRFNTARNSTRKTDVQTILSAIRLYQADNNGVMPGTNQAIDAVTGSYQYIGTNSPAVSCTLACGSYSIVGSNCVTTGLYTDLLPYLKKIPRDPKQSSDANTRYIVNLDAQGLLTVASCDSEGEGAGGGGTPPVIEAYN